MIRTLVTAIVSTAAEGAERGALAAAIELGIGYGGRTPAHTSEPALPEIYASRMRLSTDRGMAVRLNTQDSDGTLIVSFADELTGRCKYAADTAKQQRKPCQHLILVAGGRTRITEAVRAALLAWIDERHVSVLHVVGPGEDLEPGIQQATQDALVWVLEDQAADGPPEGLDAAQRAQLDASIREAAKDIREPGPPWQPGERSRARPDLGVDCIEMRILPEVKP